MSATETIVATQNYFNWVDYTIIGIIVLSAIISFFRGFLREAISLGFWIVGLLVALKYAYPVHERFIHGIASPMLSYLVAFVGIFLIVFIIGVVTNMIIHAMIKAAGLSYADRMIGIVFGVVRGAAVVIVMLLFVNNGNLADVNAISQSKIAPEFMPTVIWAQKYLPEHMQAVSSWVQPVPPSQPVQK